MFAEPSPVGLPWLLGTGYVDAWRRLHAIEESLLVLEPVRRVVGDAFADEMRLRGSNIPQSAALLKRLRAAVTNLSPHAAQYLWNPSRSDGQGGGSRPASGQQSGQG